MANNQSLKQKFLSNPLGLSMGDYMTLVQKTVLFAFDHALVKLVSLLYPLFLKDWFLSLWKESNIAKWNATGQTIKCPYCGSDHSEDFSSVHIKSGLSLFDQDAGRLKVYYGLFFPDFIWNHARRFRQTWMKLTLATPKLHGENSKIYYKKCNDCKIVFQNFPHTEQSLNLHYGKYYRREFGGTFKRAHDEKSYLMRNEHRAKQIMKLNQLKEGMRFLDVGAADGWLCLAMQNFGLEAHGIEPSSKMVESAIANGIKNMTCSPYGRKSYEEASFDAIHSFHVMEHMLTLNETLNSMNLHLKQDGQLSISVPCVDYIRNEIDGEQVLLFDHVYCFTREWFEINLPKYGFEIFEIQQNPFDAELHPEIRAICMNGDHHGGIFVFAKKQTELKNLNA